MQPRSPQPPRTHQRPAQPPRVLPRPRAGRAQSCGRAAGSAQRDGQRGTTAHGTRNTHPSTAAASKILARARCCSRRNAVNGDRKLATVACSGFSSAATSSRSHQGRSGVRLGFAAGLCFGLGATGLRFTVPPTPGFCSAGGSVLPLAGAGLAVLGAGARAGGFAPAAADTAITCRSAIGGEQPRQTELAPPPNGAGGDAVCLARCRTKSWTTGPA